MKCSGGDQIRVGINTGPVIVGTVGNNLRMDYKAVGDTVNLAGARIAVLRQDGSARQWAETARDIFADQGAKALLQEAEELLATLK